ncbi:two-component system response regulator CreB [Collimonas pratensis]|uniref:Transcriptional regulatory, C terminal family protein n=2 Tax=Collimonas pratensis TaxID=279113 RepID=A0A127QC63_9BURK|nr:transcriptional regulatory, C terminal family protein [Collimonas pratensis]NKI71303.1 two-component system response regulator CreB [Collimonas pratensis]
MSTTRMLNILLAEDESAIADTVIYALSSEGFQVHHCLLGSAALQQARSGQFDLAVLDVGLPDMSGFDVCRELRKFSSLPVIFLTARGSEIDRLIGLEIGADDYMVKPFSPRELAARIRVVLRRLGHAPAAENSTAGSTPASVTLGAFEMDAIGMRIRYAGQALQLTRYEYLLLKMLLSRPGGIFSRNQLMDSIWHDAPESTDRTVDTHVKTLRIKLKAVTPSADPIHTHRGLGYSLELAPP